MNLQLWLIPGRITHIAIVLLLAETERFGKKETYGCPCLCTVAANVIQIQKEV